MRILSNYNNIQFLLIADMIFVCGANARSGWQRTPPSGELQPGKKPACQRRHQSGHLHKQLISCFVLFLYFCHHHTTADTKSDFLKCSSNMQEFFLNCTFNICFHFFSTFIIFGNVDETITTVINLFSKKTATHIDINFPSELFGFVFK